MKRIICICLAPFLSVAGAYGQIFLVSSDYIYGSAEHREEHKADSLALISFARCLHVDIENVSKHHTLEENGRISESYSNTSNISTSISIDGLKKYVERDGRNYVIYYYLNKKEYIDSRIKEYEDNFTAGAAYSKSDVLHAKNLALGHFYLANTAVSSDTFKALYPRADILESASFERIREVYKRWDYFLSIRNVSKESPSGHWDVRDENSKTLPGFEYRNDCGEWVQPSVFYDAECNVTHIPSEYKWATIHTHKPVYRFLFEVKTDMGVTKVPVPEKFYEMVSAPLKFDF